MGSKAKYPEHEKLHEVSDMSQVCGELLEWLETEGFHLAQYGLDDDYPNTLFPTHKTKLSLLAAFFDIDQAKVDAEKDQMLREIRETS